MIERRVQDSTRRFYTRETHSHRHVPGYDLFSNPESGYSELKKYIGENIFASEFNQAIKKDPGTYNLLGVTEDFIDIFCVKATDPAADSIRTVAFNQFLDVIDQTIDIQRHQKEATGTNYKLNEAEIRGLTAFFMITTARLGSLTPLVMEGNNKEITEIQWKLYHFLNTYNMGKNKLLIESSSGGKQVMDEINNLNNSIDYLRDLSLMLNRTMAEAKDILEEGLKSPREEFDKTDMKDTAEGADMYVRRWPGLNSKN